MAKSTNTPDETDVETMMRAIEALHGGQVTMTVSPGGIGSTGGLAIVLTHRLPAVPGVEEDTEQLVTNRWPCPHHRHFWSCIFEGLYRLDSAIGRAYIQVELPKA